MYVADLHIHTTASDGVLTPKQIVREAVRKGLRAISITDHDTTDGIVSAQKEANFYKIEVIPGIEINTDYRGKEIHILGYYLNVNYPPLQEILERIRKDRIFRAREMVKKLQGLNIIIDIERVYQLAKDGAVGRPHIARAMIEKGYISSVREAFEKYIGINGPAYVERYKLTPHKAVALIIEAGGVPVLAHPGLIGDDSLIIELMQCGLQGIEAYHSDHDLQTTEYYIRFGKKNHLIITGGSDFHGYGYRDETDLGGTTVPYEAVIALRGAKLRLDGNKEKFEGGIHVQEIRNCKGKII
jgi:hypothetical protein